MTAESFTTGNTAETIYGPLTPSGVLQRTFAMYRDEPKVMFGLMLLLAAVEVMATGVISGSSNMLQRESGMRVHPLHAFMFLLICVMAWALIYVATQVVHGAYFYAVTAQLQHRSMRVGEAAGSAMQHAGRLVGLSVQMGLRIFGYVLLLAIGIEVVFGVIAAALLYATHSSMRGGNWMAFALILGPVVVVGVLLYLAAMLWVVARYAVAVPACLAENLTASDAIRRSIALSAKSKSRIYAMYVFVMVLGIASFLIVLPIAILSARAAGHTAGFLLLSAIASAVNLLFGSWLLSFTGIASTLCYYDLKVRKEGFGVAVAAVVPPVATAEPTAGDAAIS